MYSAPPITGEKMENQYKGGQPGEIMEELQNLMYRVQLDDGAQVKAHLSSLLKKVTVRLLPGERVLVDVSSFDTSRAKITKRLPKTLPA